MNLSHDSLGISNTYPGSRKGGRSVLCFSFFVCYFCVFLFFLIFLNLSVLFFNALNFSVALGANFVPIDLFLYRAHHKQKRHKQRRYNARRIDWHLNPRQPRAAHASRDSPVFFKKRTTKKKSTVFLKKGQQRRKAQFF